MSKNTNHLPILQELKQIGKLDSTNHFDNRLAAKCLFANFVDKTELINVEKVNTQETINYKLQYPPLKR